MKQLPIGDVIWRGGAGKPGEKGGWGYKCKWCNTGDRRVADMRRHLSVIALGEHVMLHHAGNTLLVEGKKMTAREYLGA